MTLPLNNVVLESTAQVHRPGSAIFWQGDPSRGFWYVDGGIVGLRRQQSQSSALTQLVHAGESLGYPGPAGGRRHATSAIALAECRVTYVDGEALARGMSECVDLEAFVRECLLSREERAEAIVREAAYPVRQRTARMIERLMLRYGRTEAGEMLVTLPVSRQELAECLRVRPETVARTIRSLQDAGVAFFSNRLVRIPCQETLACAAHDE